MSCGRMRGTGRRWLISAWDSMRWRLLALCKCFRQKEDGREAISGTLNWGEQRIPFNLKAGQSIFTHTFTLDPALIAAPLRLSKIGGKRLFAQVVAESRLPDTKQSSQDHGLRLQRRYERLNEDNRPEQLDKAKVGDRV